MSRDFELPTTHPDYTDCWDRDTYDLQDIPPVIKCEHKWKSYMGLNQQFEYCELCDEKRG